MLAVILRTPDRRVPSDWALSLRYHAGSTVVLALAVALVARAPARTDVQSRQRTAGVALDGELFPWGWTVQLNYLASQDGVVEVAFQSGVPTRVPVEAGANTIYVHLDGGGEHIEGTSRTERPGVCVSGGTVGELPAASAG